MENKGESDHCLEILENPQTVENKGESDHCLEILENLEILEIHSSSEKTPFAMTKHPFAEVSVRSPYRFMAHAVRRIYVQTNLVPELSDPRSYRATSTDFAQRSL